MITVESSPASLITAIEGDLLSWLDVFSKLEGAVLNDIPGLKRSITNLPMSLFNSIMQTRLEPGQVDETIQKITRDAQRRGVPVLWWIGPSTLPEDLSQRLLKHGFVVDEDGPGMAVDLDLINESLPVSEGVSISLADDEASWWAWCRALTQGFEAPPERAEFAANQWHYLLTRVDPDVVQAYTAWLGGKPVATSLMLLGSGVAGLYAVATIPEARRRGIGAKVTLHPLLQARAMGYKLGILEASEMGLPVYRSLGFREYCRITSYRWSPPRLGANGGTSG
jgi:GNAT superfamily N-acetyltransferase